MTTSDDLMSSFRARIAAAPKPTEPRTDAEIYDRTRTAFASLWEAVDAMNAVVRESFAVEAKVYLFTEFINRISETVIGEFRAEKPGNSLQGTRLRTIPFTFQGEAIWVKDGCFDEVADVRGELGARFSAASQDRLAGRLADVVADFYQTGL